ncbi:MAG: hypothetical protein ACOQNV_01520 [Mycoplasmoidaceae bacterium]
MAEMQNNKTIEEKSENKNFFNKRNIIIIILTTLLSIGLLVLTVLFIIDMNWLKFFRDIGSGLTLQLGALWLVLLILFMAFSIAYNYLYIWIRLRRLGVKIQAWQYFTFALSISFLKGVTPANFIYDPYTVFWLKTQGVSTSRATSIMFSNALLWQIMELLIHIPSFIILMMRVDLLLSIPKGGGVALIVLMSLGILIDIIGCLVMLLLCFSRRAHYVMSSIFNWFKKKLHMKYHTKAEIEEKYKNRATIKKEVIEYYKNWTDTLVIILILVVYEMSVYFALSSALALINADQKFSFDVMAVYHSANMAFNANRLNIIPSFGVGLEASLLAMLRVLGGINDSNFALAATQSDEFISEGIFLWRTFYTYFPALFGLCGFAGLTVYHVRSYRQKKGSFVESKYE